MFAGIYIVLASLYIGKQRASSLFAIDETLITLFETFYQHDRQLFAEKAQL